MGDTTIPVMVARGAVPGHVIGITAALHGNELNGIPLIHTCVRLSSDSRRAVIVRQRPRSTPFALPGCAACVF
jgi:hypothetical protein